MKAIIKRSEVNGCIQAPPSKSYTHRGVVCSLLSHEESQIVNPLLCFDTEATITLSEMMGARIERGETLKIVGAGDLSAPSSEMNCGGSGTTLRIFTALSSLARGTCILTGDTSLRERPMTELLQALRQLGVKAHSIGGDGKPPVEVQSEGLNGGIVSIRGDISSQYITGLLLACSKGSGDSTIEITTDLESKPYVEMTVEVMKKFDVRVNLQNSWREISVPGNQMYVGSKYIVPGDFSSSAFPLAAGVLSGKVSVTGLDHESEQGDSQIIEYLSRLGVPVRRTSDGYTTQITELSAMDFDVSNTPDLVPILTVLATQARGTSLILNASRLRFKESDRLTTTRTELNKMGARITESSDGLRIEGPTPLHGAVIDSHSDHRIAMACFVAGLIADGETTVQGIETIAKSYPSFIDDMTSLGVDVRLKSEERRIVL